MKNNRINEIYQELYKCFGAQNWWPIVVNGASVYAKDYDTINRNADDAFEISIGTILTQNTAWKNSEKAIINMKTENLLSIEALDSMDVNKLAEVIKPSGYYNQKAKKIKAFISYIRKELNNNLFSLKDKPLYEARESLLSVWGLGRETADSILLYALGMPIFVVDAYTVRFLSRLGIIESKVGYEYIQKIFQDNLPNDAKIYQEYHALIVRLGKNICRKQPVCAECMLNNICPFSASS